MVGGRPLASDSLRLLLTAAPLSHEFGVFLLSGLLAACALVFWIL